MQFALCDKNKRWRPASQKRHPGAWRYSGWRGAPEFAALEVALSYRQQVDRGLKPQFPEFPDNPSGEQL